MKNIKVQLAPKQGHNNRRDLFKSLLKKVEDVTVVDQNTPKEDISYRFYFDTDLIYRNEKALDTPIAELLEVQKEDLSKAVLDITHDQFDDEELGALLTLAIVCASFVTCIDAEMQETIYLNTGRLAHIIDNPLTPDMFKEPDSDETKEVTEPSLLWIGTLADVFSIKELTTTYKDYNVKIHNLSSCTERALQKSIERADLIVLPKTFSEEGEASRVDKVKYCLMEGKFVTAPDLPEPYTDLAYNSTLPEAVDFLRHSSITKWITTAQNRLKEKEHIDRSVSQMNKAFDLLPEDTFLDNLESFLENEEIQI